TRSAAARSCSVGGVFEGSPGGTVPEFTFAVLEFAVAVLEFTVADARRRAVLMSPRSTADSIGVCAREEVALVAWSSGRRVVRCRFATQRSTVHEPSQVNTPRGVLTSRR